MNASLFRRSSRFLTLTGALLGLMVPSMLTALYAEDSRVEVLPADPSLEPMTAPPPPMESAPHQIPDMSTHQPAAELTPPAVAPEVPADQEVVAQPAEPAPVQDTVRPAEEVRAEAMVSSTKRGSRIPAYQFIRPNWGVQIIGSANGLGGQDLASVQAGNPARAVIIQCEYQPAFLQSIGVLSVGPSVGIFPITPLNSVTSSPTGLWEVGGQIRYQARFFREQPVVPMIAYEAQYLNYRFTEGPSGAFLVSGPSLGGMLLLNFLEPSSAAEIYINQGITRSYLVAEYKLLAGRDANVSISGQSLFFGLRFEF